MQDQHWSLAPAIFRGIREIYLLDEKLQIDQVNPQWLVALSAVSSTHR
jgi:hypothetical protein